jgi:hypothetical protein
MLPDLDSIPAAAVLDRLSLLKYHNVRGSHIYVGPSGEHRLTVLDDLTRSRSRGSRPMASILAPSLR